MSRDLIRLMHALFLPGAEAYEGPAPWRPHADVYRTSNGWLVKFELAGVKAEDIELDVLGYTLTIRGHRRDAVLDAATRSGEPPPVHHLLEIGYSRFERQLELPCDLKTANITTELRDGLLLVRIVPTKEARR
ncbi:MAG: Hsp20/alpha crystallin family protein [Planctomycetia bacterium]|nr:Hsp20/alpha crystallin family protein [Planctomycetia bacterium]